MAPGLTHADSDMAPARPSEPLSAPQPDAPRRRPLGQRAALVVGGPLLLSTAAVTVLVSLFHTEYLTNDDTALVAISNGDYTGKASSSLVVAPAVLGHFLRLGYAFIPTLPWLGITLYTLQIFAWAVIGVTAFTLRRRPPIAERVVVGAVILATAPWMILRVSYTPTSLLLGVVGIIVFAVGAKVPGRVGTAYAVIGGLLLGTVYFVRVSSFLAVVIVFAPVIAIIAVKAGLRRTAAFALVVGMLVLVGFGANRLEYSRSAEWRAFMKMNSARGSLHDTPRLRQQNFSQRDLQNMGWTRNDLWLFTDFLYPDPTVYSDDNIRTLATLSPPVRKNIGVGRIYDVFRGSSDRRNMEHGPVIASLLVVGALLALRRNRISAVVTVVSVVWFLGVLIALLLYVRLPGRVLIPLEAGGALLAAFVPTYLSTASARTRSRWSWTSAATVALVALLVAGPALDGITSISWISRQNQQGTRAAKRTLARLEAFDPHGVFFARGDQLGRWTEPLSASSPFANPRLVPLGWATSSPLFTARLARVGIDDVYTALLTKPHVYLLAYPIEAQHIAWFYLQHRGVAARAVVRLRYLPVYYGSVRGFITLWSISSGRAP